METNNMVRPCRVPPIKDIETALSIYYSCIEIGSKEIRELFGVRSSATIAQMKKAAIEKMADEYVPRLGYHTVNTKVAFETWGIDIEDLERRRVKLKKLDLINHK